MVGDGAPDAGHPRTGARAVLTVRPLRPGDDSAVRSVFRATLALGRPVDDLPGLDRYEALCLDWYLEHERPDARVLDDDGTVLGYLLVGTRPVEQRRWTRRAATRYVLGTVPRLLTRGYRGDAGRFHRLRLRDGWALRRAPAPMPVHVHLNLLPTARAGRGARLLAVHADAVCRRLGAPGWFGEINARRGHRASALRRLGGEVVHQAPNRTLGWLVGSPVDRLTVVRRLDVVASERVA